MLSLYAQENLERLENEKYKCLSDEIIPRQCNTNVDELEGNKIRNFNGRLYHATHFATSAIDQLHIVAGELMYYPMCAQLYKLPHRYQYSDVWVLHYFRLMGLPQAIVADTQVYQTSGKWKGLIGPRYVGPKYPFILYSLPSYLKPYLSSEAGMASVLGIYDYWHSPNPLSPIRNSWEKNILGFFNCLRGMRYVGGSAYNQRQWSFRPVISMIGCMNVPYSFNEEDAISNKLISQISWYIACDQQLFSSFSENNCLSLVCDKTNHKYLWRMLQYSESCQPPSEYKPSSYCTTIFPPNEILYGPSLFIYLYEQLFSFCCGIPITVGATIRTSDPEKGKDWGPLYEIKLDTNLENLEFSIFVNKGNNHLYQNQITGEYIWRLDIRGTAYHIKDSDIYLGNFKVFNTEAYTYPNVYWVGTKSTINCLLNRMLAWKVPDKQLKDSYLYDGMTKFHCVRPALDVGYLTYDQNTLIFSNSLSGYEAVTINIG